MLFRFAVQGFLAAVLAELLKLKALAIVCRLALFVAPGLVVQVLALGTL